MMNEHRNKGEVKEKDGKRSKVKERKRKQKKRKKKKKNKAGYTATPVACGWAGAVFVTSSFGQEQ